MEDKKEKIIVGDFTTDWKNETEGGYGKRKIGRPLKDRTVKAESSEQTNTPRRCMRVYNRLDIHKHTIQGINSEKYENR